MKLAPIVNVYQPLFRAECSKCSQMHDGHNLAAVVDASPFTFLCMFCAGGSSNPQWAAVSYRYAEEFLAMSEAQKAAVRQRLNIRLDEGR